jgi:hypothetical protein
MASLALEAHSFLKHLMESYGKQQDELVTGWDDELAEALPHEGHVLPIGKPGAQKILHCLTYETISLPPCFFCDVYSKCVLWMVLFHFCVMCS